MLKFEEERKGYNREQVEEYVSTIQKEYKNLQQELAEEQQKAKRFYAGEQEARQELAATKQKAQQGQKRQEQLEETLSQLTKETEQLQKENQALQDQVKHLQLSSNPAYSDAIASALVSAEMSAKQIIANAKKEAELTSASAMRDLSDIIGAKQEVLTGIAALAGKLTKILNEEEELKAAGEMEAQRIYEANAEQEG